MRIEGSERQAINQRQLPPASSTAANASIGGGDSVPALDSLGAGFGGDATHVDGGAAACPFSFTPAVAVETVTVGTAAIPFTMSFPGVADTLPGTAGMPVISLLDCDENAAAVSLLGAGPGAVATAPAWRDDAGPARGESAPGGTPGLGLEQCQVVWTDPTSVEGASVLAIGGATLVLSDLVWPYGVAAAR
jgi:hypothetical protein